MTTSSKGFPVHRPTRIPPDRSTATPDVISLVHDNLARPAGLLRVSGAAFCYFNSA